jgi:peroxiredoxin Q/BCP
LSRLLADGPVVLFFYPIAMTSGCTAEACHFRDMASEFAGVGAQRVGISTDPVAKQKEFSEANNFDYPLLSDQDGTVAREFGVKRGLLGKLAPVQRKTFVIGADRKIIEVIKSEVKFTAHADRALEVLAAGGSRSGDLAGG